MTEQSDKARVSGSVRSESDYYVNLEENLKEERENSRQLEAEVQTLRLRLDRSVVQSQRVSSLEDALNVKSDELNDLRRKTISLEKQVGVLEAEGKEERSEKEALRKENSALKTRLLESGQEVRKSYEMRDLDSKKNVQRLTEDIATLTSELRDERRAAARLQVELQTHKAEVQRLEELAEQGKRKELAIFEELGQLRTTYESTCEEGERLKSELRFQKGV
jgi:chromosome segregation ATPase